MGARRQAIVAAALALVLLSQLHGTQALLVRPQLTCGSPGARHSSRSSLLIRGAPLPCTTMMANPAPRATAGAGGGVAGDIPGAGSGANRGHIVLGSKSFTRKMIVEEMGFTPIVRSADIDEAAIGDRASDPAELVLLLGEAKAEALLPGLKAEAAAGSLGSTTILLTGDQVVVHEGRILEKPAGEDEVRRNILGYGRSPCRTVGSVVLTDVLTGRQVSGVDTAEISFDEIPQDVVTQLCIEGTVLQCAGGLMIEHPLVQPYISKIDGTVDSVMGLSKALVLRLLEGFDDGDPSSK